MTTQVTFEAFGQRYVAQLGIMQPDWSNRRRPYYPSHASVGFDLVERPAFGADETEWKAWRRASITLAQPLIDAALTLFGVEAKARFSAKKLCCCGCSPAWILESSFHPIHGSSFYVNVSREEHVSFKITEQPIRKTITL